MWNVYWTTWVAAVVLGWSAVTFVIGFRAYGRLRYSLGDLMLAVLGYGGVLASGRYVFERLGVEESALYPLAIAVGSLIVLGFKTGCQNREQLRESAWLLRTLVYCSGLLFPATVVPALLVPLLMVMPGSTFRNDWNAAAGWLFLLAPVLGQFWFWSIAEARKTDKPSPPPP